MLREVNGVRLNVACAGVGPALVLLHGFTGSGATWQSTLPSFAAHRRTIAVDLLGHGGSDSPVDPERYRMERCVVDLVALLDSHGVGRADVLGYSMGARVALHLAAAAPERVGALILESGSPGLADPAEREARILADERLADRIEGEGVPAFASYWEQLPLFASQAALPDQVRARLRQERRANNPVGLANSLRGMGAGRQPSLWERLPALQMPTLLVAGALDAKYRAIARQMGALVPGSLVKIAADAGHNVHLERPDAFAEIVRQFLLMPGAQESPNHSDPKEVEQ